MTRKTPASQSGTNATAPAGGKKRQASSDRSTATSSSRPVPGGMKSDVAGSGNTLGDGRTAGGARNAGKRDRLK